MESRATAKASEYMQDFKDDIKDFVLGQDCSHEVKSAIMQQIYNYRALEFTKEDFIKRKRMKNVVPRCDRCCAKRANDDQCTRKRRDGSSFVEPTSRAHHMGLLTTFRIPHLLHRSK